MSQTNPMTCEEAIRLLMMHLDGELPRTGHDAVQQHLDACRSCGSRAEFERRLRAGLAELRSAPVGAAFEGRVRALVAQFPAAATPGGQDAPGPFHAPRPPW